MPNCTTCLLTTGFAPSCDRVVPGGNKNVAYFIDRCQIAAVVDSPYDLVIDSFTLDVGAAWKEVTFRPDTVVWSQVSEAPNRSVRQSFTGVLESLSDNTDKELAAQEARAFYDKLRLSQDGFSILVKDKAGVWRLLGYENGLKLQAEGGQTSGTVTTDVAGITITLADSQTQSAQIVEPAYVDAL